MTSGNAKTEAALLLLLGAVLSPARAADTSFGGHAKLRATADTYSADSLFHDVAGSSAAALTADLRLNFGVTTGRWSFDAAWQAAAGYGEAFEVLRAAGGLLPGVSSAPDDRRRLLDLTDVVRDEGRTLLLHRLDRLSATWTTDRTVVRIGRQAISWGNGLIFSPLDIVNPFDPQAIDVEYKAGDDMLYAQWLRDNGDDLQFAHVFRRDPVTGSRGRAYSTTAFKYHGIAGDAEYDLLLAEHYDSLTFGVGGNLSLGGAVLRGDAVVSDGAGGTDLQAVLNLSHSWVWRGLNVTGLVEYFHAGFGLHGGHYDVARIAGDAELAARLARGDAFTVGRNYVAGGMTVEVTPLTTVTPTLFVNADDGSAFLQVVSKTSLSDEALLIAALNLPIGPDGSEYGGIAGPAGTRYLARDLGLFLQFAWYF